VYNLLANITPPGPVVIPDSAWSAPEVATASTAHPYLANAQNTFSFTHPGARFMRIRFAKFDTETTYDKLIIRNAAGEVVDSLSGTLPENYWSVETDGDKITVEFTSDGSVNKYGFDISAFEWTTFSGERGIVTMGR